MSRSHPQCWTGAEYDHGCHVPSGRACVQCGAPAGTPWGPYWCPPCDVIRLDRISASLESISATLHAQQQGTHSRSGPSGS